MHLPTTLASKFRFLLSKETNDKQNNKNTNTIELYIQIYIIILAKSIFKSIFSIHYFIDSLRLAIYVLLG